MKVIAVIPARWGSTRFPGKPLAIVDGKSLVRHVWERCVEAKAFDEIYVATDSVKIKNAVGEFGGKALITSRSCASGTDRVAEVARKIKADVYVNVQGDGPLVEKKEIVNCIKAAEKSGFHEIVTTAAKIRTRKQWENPSVVKVVCDDNGYALYFSRTPIPFVRDKKWPKNIALAHLSIYAFTRKNLLAYSRLSRGILEKHEQLEMLRALQAGWRLKIVLASDIHPEVDSPEDIVLVEAALRKKTVR